MTEKTRLISGARRNMLSVAWCAALFLFLCAPLPSQVGSDNYPLQLTLEDGAKTSAIFSGTPVKAYITLPDSTPFDKITWHMGSGLYLHPDIPPSKKITKAEVLLVWNTIPVCKDTVKKMNYDTLYVSTYNESTRSNRVIVYVTNIAPLIDSLRIGASFQKSDDTVRYVIPVSDTVKHLGLRAITRDPNNDPLRYDWFSHGLGVSFTPAQTVLYDVPQKEFCDTITVTVYDGKGGSDAKVIVLSKLSPNKPPAIDSLLVGNTLFLGQDTLLYRYYATVMDTVRFRLYATDKDIGDTFSIKWTNKNSKKASEVPVGKGTTMLWKGDSSLKEMPPRDTVRIIDTVCVVVKDSRGDSAVRSILILQGRKNNPPQIDSVRIDSVVALKGGSYAYTDSVTVFDTVRLKFYFSDPDTDAFTWSFKGRRPAQYQINTDSTIMYACKDSLWKDTLVVTVKDTKGDSAQKTIVINVMNRFPLIDSIIVLRDTAGAGKSVHKGSDSLFVSGDTARSNDTLFFRVFAHDPDSLDMLTIKWTASVKPLSVKAKDAKGLLAAYICTTSAAYNDTVRVTVTDKRKKSAVKSVVIRVRKEKRNTPPRIDSIRINSTIVCKDTVKMYRDTSANGKDPFLIQVFASDKDSADTVRSVVSARFPLQIAKLPDSTFKYTCRDTLYLDSIVVTVKDNFGDSVKKSIVVKVTNRYPVIDSLRVRDLPAKIDTLFTGKDSSFVLAPSAVAKDTVVLIVFSRDPDRGAPHNDSIVTIDWVASSGVPLIKQDAKGARAKYIGNNAAYSDTIRVTVIDRKQKATAKSLILTVGK
jgi:hypothetical protein